MSAKAHCLCGAVKMTAKDPESHVHACHCDMCRRWSGGPGMAVAVAGVEFDGEEHVGRFASSDWAERGFCKQCGSHLFYYLRGGDRYMLWAGIFDDDSGFELAGEIFVDEKPPGYDFAGDHPRMTGAEFMASLQQQ